jgi:putative transposase
MKYQFIHTEKANFPVMILCRVLQVSRSGFYSFLVRKKSKCESEDSRITARIRRVFFDSRRSYGSPRIYQELRSIGIKLGRHKIARIMRANGIIARKSRRNNTQVLRCNNPSAPNILARQFSPKAANLAWVSDITYLPACEGWLYLASIMDLYSRRIIGFAIDKNLETSIAANALKMAIFLRRPAPGLIHHSDQGCQYKAQAYQDIINNNGIICSMSRRGNCYDNAVKESFFKTLKTELFQSKKKLYHHELKSAVIDYIVSFYNLKRRHSAIGYLSPIDFENINARKITAS